MNSNIENKGNVISQYHRKSFVVYDDYKKKLLLSKDNYIFTNFINWYNISDAILFKYAEESMICIMRWICECRLYTILSVWYYKKKNAF